MQVPYIKSLRKALEDTTAVAKNNLRKKRFKVYKIVWVAKETELRGPIFKKGPRLSCQGGICPLTLSVHTQWRSKGGTRLGAHQHTFAII